MAHPWIFESNFEAGTNAEWDSETDTGSLLDFPHYSTLAREPLSGMPYRGAYCMRIVMGDTNDHTLIEGDIDVADTVTRYSAFNFYLGKDVLATADDTFNIYEVQGTANAVENAVGLRITATTDLVEIGVGQVAPTVFRSSPLSKGAWHHIELETTVQTGVTGTGLLYVDGVLAATIDTLTNTAVLRGVLGTQNTAATTTGTVLFDEFVFDDARIYPDRERFPHHIVLTKTGHAFVGPGTVASAAMMQGTSMILYDTDTASVLDAQGVVAELTDSLHTNVGGPLTFKRGCYVALSGTTPRGEIIITTSSVVPGATGPKYYSEWGMRHYGQLRKQRPNNV